MDSIEEICVMKLEVAMILLEKNVKLVRELWEQLIEVLKDDAERKEYQRVGRRQKSGK
uniref:Uncharacterized protein n=1 Tax=viral metagenome TaxID=1070528 RepID=A0A6M3JB99_9ZZZZ